MSLTTWAPFFAAVIALLYITLAIHMHIIGKTVHNFPIHVNKTVTGKLDGRRAIHIAQIIIGSAQCRAEVLALKSILARWNSNRKHAEMHHLHLHLICDAKSWIIMNTMLQTWQLNDVTYTIYTISNYKDITNWMKSPHYSATPAVLRVYLPDILSSDVTKVLSIDTDVIFLGDISELWATLYEANENQAISMAMDESWLYTIKFRTNVTTELDGGYNVGVTVLHLDRLRQRNWTALWTSSAQALLNSSEILVTAEQDIFNVVVWMHKELFYPLPCVWNIQLNPTAAMSICPHSRGTRGGASGVRPPPKLLHNNRRNKFEYEDDEYLQPSDVPAMEKCLKDRIRWYLAERKAITLLDGYHFANLTAQLSHEEIEKIFQQVHSNVKLPTSQEFCTENKNIYGFCVGGASTQPVPRMHAHFVEGTKSHQMQVTGGTSLIIRTTVDRIHELEKLASIWKGPVSVGVCASDRQAFRLPRVLRGYRRLSRRKNISYHVVYTSEANCADAFAHNAAVAFSLTSHVLVLKDVRLRNVEKAFPAIQKYITVGGNNSSNNKSAAFIFELQNPFKGTQTSPKKELLSHSCQPNDKICRFKLLKLASAVILPVEISLVPSDASADSFFDILLWNLVNASSDMSDIVKVPIS